MATARSSLPSPVKSPATMRDRAESAAIAVPPGLEGPVAVAQQHVISPSPSSQMSAIGQVGPAVAVEVARHDARDPARSSSCRHRMAAASEPGTCRRRCPAGSKTVSALKCDQVELPSPLKSPATTSLGSTATDGLVLIGRIKRAVADSAAGP